MQNALDARLEETSGTEKVKYICTKSTLYTGWGKRKNRKPCRRKVRQQKPNNAVKNIINAYPPQGGRRKPRQY